MLLVKSKTAERKLLTRNRVAVPVVVLIVVLLFAVSWHLPQNMPQYIRLPAFFSDNNNYNYTRNAWTRTGTASANLNSTCANRGNGNANCAIFYLAHQPRVPQLLTSMAHLFRNFNSKYRYPVVVFYDDKYGKEFFDVKDLLNKLKIPEQDKTLIHFEYVQFVFPEGFSEANKSQVTVWPHAFPPYNHMIAFWGYYVFHHPLVQCLDYFWRLDTDTNIFDPVKVDLFEVMRQNHYHYGYHTQASDPDFVTVGLSQFVSSYVTENKIKVAQEDRLKDVLGTKLGGQIPIYYNNFEIVHVPTFLRSDMEAFRLAFLMTYRIYTHRWGDAPQRYAMVNMFLNQSEVHQVCESPYEQQGWHIAASC